MKKTYEYLYGTSANVTLEIDGNIRSILFDGGRANPRFTRPKYKTSDTAEQKAIEGSPFFNNLIFLTKEEKDEKIERPQVIPAPVVDVNPTDQLHILPPIESIKSEEPAEKKIEEVVEPSDKNGPTEYPVTKVQDAREILITEYKVKPSQLPNKDSILKAALELNVSFPNLP